MRTRSARCAHCGSSLAELIRAKAQVGRRALVHCGLLPAPLPFPFGEGVQRLGPSWGTLRRVRCRLHWQAWADGAVTCLTDIGGLVAYAGCESGSAAQRACLDRLVDALRDLPPPTKHIDSAGALQALCGPDPGYTLEELHRATFSRELVSLPPQ